MFQYAQADESLTTASATPAGIGRGTVFDIVRRTFVFVSEAEVAELQWCSSPYFESKGAKGGATVPGKASMFCFRPDPVPKVSVFRCQPADLGFPLTGSGGGEISAKPYCATTLNLVAQGAEGMFTGQWRAMSCACAACQYGRTEQSLSRCTSRGEGFQPLPWERYTVARAPAVPRTGTSFIGMMVDAALIAFDPAGGELELSALVQSTAKFIRQKLHRFRNAAAAQAYVKKRVKNNQKGNWVEQAALAISAQLPRAHGQIAIAVGHGEAMAELKAKATFLGWAPADGVSWDEFTRSLQL